MRPQVHQVCRVVGDENERWQIPGMEATARPSEAPVSSPTSATHKLESVMK